ncbi:MAG: hypothetical protein ACLFTK_16635 [Anaerolineales bacterium]
MSDLYNRIVSNRGTLESIAARIPGIKGYMEQSARREADRMMRDHVAGQFESLMGRYAAIESDLARADGGLMLMDKSKSIRSKMENLRRKIATDTPGYSGFFATNKIGPEELAQVYAFDEAMLRYADAVAEKLDALAAAVNSNEGVAEALQALDETMVEAAQAYDLRDDLLNGIA